MQKTAYEMRISDWSSDVCSSDLNACVVAGKPASSVSFAASPRISEARRGDYTPFPRRTKHPTLPPIPGGPLAKRLRGGRCSRDPLNLIQLTLAEGVGARSQSEDWRVRQPAPPQLERRSEEHTSELKSLVRISHAVLCMKKKHTTR